MTVVSQIRQLLKGLVLAFIEDEVLSRGAAFYAVPSLAPVLLIVIAIAELVFGQDAAKNAIVAQLRDLGPQTEQYCTALWRVPPASPPAPLPLPRSHHVDGHRVRNIGEMRPTLNATWKASLAGITVSRLIRARAASRGLVALPGPLLIVSLAVSATSNLMPAALAASKQNQSQQPEIQYLSPYST